MLTAEKILGNVTIGLRAAPLSADWRHQLRDKNFEQHVEAMRHALEKHNRMRWGAPGSACVPLIW